MAPIITSLASIVKQFGIGAVVSAAPSIRILATGGETIDYTTGDIDYRAHIFSSTGTFTVTDPAITSIDVLVVAGGGGGGQNHGGGGGAGGLLYGTSFPVTATSYPIVIGAGGVAATPNTNANGGNGSQTTFTTPGGTATATGGGGGGSRGSSYDATGSAGGSGGGGGWPEANVSYPGGPGTQAPQLSGALTGYGNPGGNADANGGGGGGAGGSGGAARPSISGGNPGSGRDYSISGMPITYAVGGRGGTQDVALGWANPSPLAFNSAGSGGNGGIGGYGRGSNGQSGTVILKYTVPSGSGNSAKATGGAISFYGGKTIHVFTSSGTFTTKSNWTAASVEYVVIGGGGGGGGDAGGGGGAGGYLTGTTPIGAHPVSTSIQVGAGAAFPGISGGQGGTGTPSYFGTPLTGYGGGGGGGGGDPGPYAIGGAGGSGGGARGNRPTSTTGAGPSPYTPQQGYPGGNGNPPPGPPIYSGGGGGAGGAGEGSGGGPSHGGIGRQIPSTFRNPTMTVGSIGPTGPVPATNPGGDTTGYFWVAGGGGGVRISAPASGVGGGGGGPYAGGGNAAYPDTQVPGNSTPGAQNTGAGGGGGTQGPPSPYLGTNGGSGIVLIAYPT